MKDEKKLVNVESRPWKYSDIEYWVNPVDNCCNATIIFDGKRSRLRAGIIIIKDGKILLGEEADEQGVFSLPGGGFNKYENPLAAAIREAQEEVFINVTNAVDTELDYCECHSEVKPWVKENVPKEKWWYNYYTCLVIADYKSIFNGKVDSVDLDKSMSQSSKWYDIADVINRPDFKTQWKKALIKYGYYKEPVLEGINTDKAKATFGITRNVKKAAYILEDGSLLDFSDGQSYRALDHRDISDIYPDIDSASDALVKFMTEENAIRWLPEMPGFCMINKPNKAQFEAINEIIDIYTTQEYFVDIWDQNGYSRLYFSSDNLQAGQTIETVLNNYFDKHIILSNLLTEDTRTLLISKSRNKGEYKDKSRGKNRFERKKYSRIANSVKSYNSIDMNSLFKKDILTVSIPVTGETDNYTVTIQMEGVIAEIARGIKSNNNKLEFKVIIQALTKIFNTKDIKTNCDCLDHKYNFDHWNIINNISIKGTDKDPGPGKGIANPNNDKGIGCKHVLLVLNNGEWLMKIASVINNYCHYVSEKMHKAFIKLIFPKLYGVPADEAAENDIVENNEDLDTNKDLIDIINKWAAVRGRYKKGSNKNPITNTGGRTKKDLKNKADDTDEESDSKKEKDTD